VAIGYAPGYELGDQTMFRWMMLVMLIAVVAGCSDTLETGYKPRALKDSPTIRRSYYASPFSPEARAPGMEKEQEYEARRPRQGY
jgi:hypothetical protein